MSAELAQKFLHVFDALVDMATGGVRHCSTQKRSAKFVCQHLRDDGCDISHTSTSIGFVAHFEGRADQPWILSHHRLQCSACRPPLSPRGSLLTAAELRFKFLPTHFLALSTAASCALASQRGSRRRPRRAVRCTELTRNGRPPVRMMNQAAVALPLEPPQNPGRFNSPAFSC